MMKKIISVILASVFMLFPFVLSASASDRLIKVSVNGAMIQSDNLPRLIDSTTYVPLVAFCAGFGSYKKSYNDSTSTASVSSAGVYITAKKGEKYIIANGRYLYSGCDNLIINSTMFVPVRTLSKAYGAEVSWDGVNYSVSVSGYSPIESGDSFYNENDVLWLSRIISAESNTEPLTGKIAVGNVILNRVRSREFPGSIYDVIFDRKYGVQFSPVSNGSIYNTPSESCIIAAKICLDGYSVSDGILYFMNAALASSTWISDNREYAFSIGRHSFYY